MTNSEKRHPCSSLAAAADSNADATLVTGVGVFGRMHRFSQREEQILLMLVQGWHPKEIGDAIGCGYASVRTHLRRMYKKLGCSGIRELVVRFLGESLASGFGGVPKMATRELRVCCARDSSGD